MSGRDKRWREGRQAEGRDRHARYYAINDHPNSRDFGTAEFVDSEGREYRIATSGHVPGRYVRLWVRLPRDVPWYRDRPGRLRIRLRASGDEHQQEEEEGGGGRGDTSFMITVREAFRSSPAYRTAHVHVPELEFPPEMLRKVR